MPSTETSTTVYPSGPKTSHTRLAPSLFVRAEFPMNHVLPMHRQSPPSIVAGAEVRSTRWLFDRRSAIESVSPTRDGAPGRVTSAVPLATNPQSSTKHASG